MRFGIHLPSAGALSEPAALTATAVAADQLGYATVWSAWPGQLAQVAAVTEVPGLGWIVDETPGTTMPRLSALRPWTGRLAGVVAPRTTFARVRSGLPGVPLLDCSADLPDPCENVGWAPSGYPGPAAICRWRSQHPHRPLVLRWEGLPTSDELAEISRLDIDELVVGAAGAVSLDDQLAIFARVAEALVPS